MSVIGKIATTTATTAVKTVAKGGGRKTVKPSVTKAPLPAASGPGMSYEQKLDRVNATASTVDNTLGLFEPGKIIALIILIALICFIIYKMKNGAKAAGYWFLSIFYKANADTDLNYDALAKKIINAVGLIYNSNEQLYEVFESLQTDADYAALKMAFGAINGEKLESYIQENCKVARPYIQVILNDKNIVNTL